MATRRTKSAPKKPWSFLAYIAGDNNLSDYSLIDLDELCKVGASSSTHVAVQIDTYGEHDGSIRYDITEPDWEGVAHRTVIARLAESNSGNPAVLRNFLNWGFKRYAAARRLVVVWNHGSGFRLPDRNIAYDDFGTSMDMPQVVEALTKAGVGPNNKLSVLGFDACLMNMLEIAYHFSDHAEVLVGSQQTEPGEGWPYDKVLAAMNKNPAPGNLGKAIVQAYIADYQKRGEVDVTQSAIDLAKTAAAMQAVDALGKALIARGQSARAGVRKARLSVQSYEYADYVDAVHLARLLGEEVKEASTQAQRVVREVKRCVLASKKYGSNVENSNGLSLWFPSHANQYWQYRSKYLQLKGRSSESGWVTFLDGYFAA